MYEVFKRTAAVAEALRNNEVALTYADGLADYTHQLMQYTAQLDVKRMMLGRLTSELGNELLAQELVAFAMTGINIGQKIGRRS
ncbi:hypothetical protein [Frankia sp. Cj3]|uniref:hypothetical protein n=1 Tax=Frankia sp. Cj3 TaxID=2880976 RepID=UPI001EF50856|nr:hypothetical protein [Frankia sp. Cj3]